jgi:hypothetical protein
MVKTRIWILNSPATRRPRSHYRRRCNVANSNGGVYCNDGTDINLHFSWGRLFWRSTGNISVCGWNLMTDRRRHDGVASIVGRRLVSFATVVVDCFKNL